MKDSHIKVLAYTSQLKSLYTIIRDRTTERREFVFYSKRILRLVLEEALNELPVLPKKITTPTNSSFFGSMFKGGICSVSILRSGEAMEDVVRDVCPGIKLGKILIQRDEKTALPKLFFSKLPKDISKRNVLLLDPMLGTGGSVCTAIEVLKKNKVSENKILFLNLISCPEGINRVRKSFPKVKIITGFVDPKMNTNHYLVPGIGDFGDRFFGTE